MKYFRENSRLISRIFVNQIGMTIFGVILTTAVMRATNNNHSITLLVSLFATLLYLALIYNVMWEEGARNIIRIEAGRMEASPLFPVKAALFASIPNLVLALLLGISCLLMYPLGVEFFRGIYGALHIILALFEAMYLGLFKVILDAFPEPAVQDAMSCLLYFLSSLPMILVAWGAYALGSRNIYIFGKRSSDKPGRN